jgi:hypothetical protein
MSACDWTFLIDLRMRASSYLGHLHSLSRCVDHKRMRYEVAKISCIEQDVSIANRNVVQHNLPLSHKLHVVDCNCSDRELGG